jgi:RNA polymerase sigma-70 factor (ECF subfamily)
MRRTRVRVQQPPLQEPTPRHRATIRGGHRRRSDPDGTRRSRALTERIALLDGVASHATATAEVAITRREALERLARLDDQHREALLLVSWDGLTNDQAATVLGIKPATFRRRLSRARAALEPPRTSGSTDSDPQHIPAQELS